ncbi:MAG: sensor hybrid histidine kinase, partial [Flaviaesturariibacter sp.]|nr:sensor hybrid histidine kinase [Flaviaesturariibacter sp.]
AQNILRFIVEYTDSSTGAFYLLYGEKHLQLQSSIALTEEWVAKDLQFGEGLAGQAAATKRVQELKAITDENYSVKTTSGALKLSAVIAVPILFENKVIGVIELAAMQPYSTAVKAFLTTASYNTGITINSAKSRAKLQELFEQTQAQAEELQAQHSELENMNTELEAQANKLQASEEELRVQQEELQQTNSELEERSRLLEEKNQMIVERNLEIQRKAEELEVSTKYKSEFLANMSHELRTPLNSILLLSRLLADNTEKNLSADQVEYAQVIRNSGTSLLSLIDEILDLSKIEAGKMDLEYAPVSIAEITDGMRSLFAQVAKEKGLELNVIVSDKVPSGIETDRMRLEQVLKNLLSNALKFTSKGSVTLQVAPEPGQQGMLRFSVKDTGIGIAKEKQALIFEAFQQEDGSTRRKYGGTGLGLSISRELAKLLGGEIQISSEPGKGSEFFVLVPVVQPAQKPEIRQEPTPTAMPQPSLEEPIVQEKPNLRSNTIPESVPDDRTAISPGDKAILIIEDDTAFAKALLDFTRKQGYKGLVAVRGDEGVALAQQ